MCRAVRCKTCQKTTWSGCGMHVAQVRGRVPADQWCPGHPSGSTPSGAADAPSWLRRVFGRGTDA